MAYYRENQDLCYVFKKEDKQAVKIQKKFAKFPEILTACRERLVDDFNFGIHIQPSNQLSAFSRPFSPIVFNIKRF